MQNFIFDIDGTLIDSVDAHAGAWKAAFQALGMKVDPNEIRSQIGKGADQLLPAFLDDNELRASGGEIERLKNELFRERFLGSIKPFPRARELLARLKSDGGTVALATSASQEDLDEFKRILDIEKLVDLESSSEDAHRSKPAPDIFHKILSMLPAHSEESTIVIGDSPYDAVAARRAGLRTVGVKCGGFHLERCGCVKIYDDPADILDHYREFITL